MTKWEKEILKSRFKTEKEVISELENIYTQSLNDVNNKLERLMLRKDRNEKWVLNRRKYLNALKTQISETLNTLHSQEFVTIDEYLSGSYHDGFLGTLYVLQKQGLPFVFPIDAEKVARAVINDSNLSEKLYLKLGKNMSELKRGINAEISRGMINDDSYIQIAEKIEKRHKIGQNRAIRIVRTESNRIYNRASFDVLEDAKKNGADVFKQWDATLDKRTRPNHAALDGNIKAYDEPFEIYGYSAMFPGDFGVAKEDINCRCVILTRAKWALDDDELATLKKRAEYFGLDKSNSFTEFKKQFLKIENFN